MKGNREIDVKVAETIMGYENINKNILPEHKYKYTFIVSGKIYILPWFSRDMATAWRVVKKLHEQDIYVEIEGYGGKGNKAEYKVSFYEMGELIGRAIAAGAPLAICLAALDAAGKEKW